MTDFSITLIVFAASTSFVLLSAWALGYLK